MSRVEGLRCAYADMVEVEIGWVGDISPMGRCKILMSRIAYLLILIDAQAFIR